MPTRREFLQSAAAAAGAVPALSSQAAGARVIDAHAHMFHHGNPNWRENERKLIDAADKLGIDQLCCSILPPERPTKLESFRDCNRWLAEAIQRFPGRVLGYCFVNPGYSREACDEVRRYVQDHGFIGVKLYNDYRATDPAVRPVLETAIDLKVPILHHAGHTTWLNEAQPNISDGAIFAEVARRYPELMLICAHIAGGGDWEWEIKALRNAPTVYLDTAGSNIDEGMVEMAARILGVDRLLFACDMSMTASVGRIRGAQLGEADKAKILAGNMRRILSRRSA